MLQFDIPDLLAACVTVASDHKLLTFVRLKELSAFFTAVLLSCVSVQLFI
jgi:hypothetical protein